MKEKIIELCKEYGFLVYDESVEGHFRPSKIALEALTAAYIAGEESRLELLEVR